MLNERIDRRRYFLSFMNYFCVCVSVFIGRIYWLRRSIIRCDSHLFFFMSASRPNRVEGGNEGNRKRMRKGEAGGKTLRQRNRKAEKKGKEINKQTNKQTNKQRKKVCVYIKRKTKKGKADDERIENKK